MNLRQRVNTKAAANAFIALTGRKATSNVKHTCGRLSATHKPCPLAHFWIFLMRYLRRSASTQAPTTMPDNYKEKSHLKYCAISPFYAP